MSCESGTGLPIAMELSGNSHTDEKSEAERDDDSGEESPLSSLGEESDDHKVSKAPKKSAPVKPRVGAAVIKLPKLVISGEDNAPKKTGRRGRPPGSKNIQKAAVQETKTSTRTRKAAVKAAVKAAPKKSRKKKTPSPSPENSDDEDEEEDESSDEESDDGDAEEDSASPTASVAGSVSSRTGLRSTGRRK